MTEPRITDARIAEQLALAEKAWVVGGIKNLLDLATVISQSYPAALRALAETRRVLEELCDLQNGPPLVKYEEDWTRVMAEARALLGEEAGDGG